MTKWSELSADERRRFLSVLEGIRQGAVEHAKSDKGRELDRFMARATEAAMAELRKVDVS